MFVGQLGFLSSNMSEDVFEIFMEAGWGRSEDEGKSPSAWWCGGTKSAFL